MEKINESILDFFPIDEGFIDQYFGKIRQGKTYIATADALRDLESGRIVYANWRIKFDGYDERKSYWKRFLALIGLKRYFFYFPPENFHYLPLSNPCEWQKKYGLKNFHEVFSTLTDCVVYLDEGHIVFDSYLLTRMPPEQRGSILHTAHFNRTIKIISQRPTAIHVTLRANVNRFFQCEKTFDFAGIKVFRKTEYQEMTNDENVDLDQPESSVRYWGHGKIYDAYDTKYLRGDIPANVNFAEIYFVLARDIYQQLVNFLRLRFAGKKEKMKLKVAEKNNKKLWTQN